MRHFDNPTPRFLCRIAFDYRHFVHQLAELAQQTGIVLAKALVELLWQQRIILPTINVIEHVCSEALIHAAQP